MVEYFPETNDIVMSKNDYLRLDTGFYKYIGKVKTIKDVPNSNCLYVIDEYLYIRRVDINKLNSLKPIEKPIKETDESDELDLEVHPGDDSTLVIIKELLKGFTKNSFRKLFDNDSDMNNMRRAIEKSPNGQLSLNRFRMILDKLGLKYKIIVFSDDLDTKPNLEIEEKLKKINSDNLGKNVNENDEDNSSENEEF